MAHIKNYFVSYHSIYCQNLFNTTPYFPNILGKQTFTAPLKTLLLGQSASLNHISISWLCLRKYVLNLHSLTKSEQVTE